MQALRPRYACELIAPKAQFRPILPAAGSPFAFLFVWFVWFVFKSFGASGLAILKGIR